MRRISRGEEAIESAVFTTATMQQPTVNWGLIDLQIIVDTHLVHMIRNIKLTLTPKFAAFSSDTNTNNNLDLFQSR